MREVLQKRWRDVGDKIVRLAEEFPAGKYDFRPVPEARSFADQLRHVAFWNRYVAQTLRGEPADGDANELPRAEFPNRARIVPALAESFAGVATALADGKGRPAPDLDTLVAFIEHNGEHYGQLAVYYRLNGLVPPASR
ncbi:MAG: DinB family protein [Thermoanaerobaculia bacterium]